MSDSAKRRGDWGEAVACEFLAGRDYSLVAKGWRSRFGEIDLIVKNSEFVVFVEVKLRKNASFAQAREYVGRAKQRKIVSTAQLWLSSHDTGLQPRFDVIEVYAPVGSSSPEIFHIENAF